MTATKRLRMARRTATLVTAVFVAAVVAFSARSASAASLWRIVPDGQCRPVALQSAVNGNYVSTELGWGSAYNQGELRARAGAIGLWEQFHLCNLPGDSRYY